MTARIDSLIADDYKIQRFRDLPTPDQLAIVWFMAVDGEAWDGIDLSALQSDCMKSELTGLIPKFEELYGETLFGSASLSATAIQDSVMQDADISEDYSSWDEYHSDYLAGGAPKHPESDRWPVILSVDDSETLRDGWHRFHSYVRDGATGIPAVFFPQNHHVIAHTESS